MNPADNRRILIIDDHPDIIDDFRKILAPNRTLADKVAQNETAIFGKEISIAHRPQFELEFARQGSEGRLERLNTGARLIAPFWQLGSSEFTNFEDAVETRNAFVHRRIPPGQAAEHRECKTGLGSREDGAAGKR